MSDWIAKFVDLELKDLRKRDRHAEAVHAVWRERMPADVVKASKIVGVNGRGMLIVKIPNSSLRYVASLHVRGREIVREMAVATDGRCKGVRVCP